jgi:hypothetical protein
MRVRIRARGDETLVARLVRRYEKLPGIPDEPDDSGSEIGRTVKAWWETRRKELGNASND